MKDIGRMQRRKCVVPLIIGDFEGDFYWFIYFFTLLCSLAINLEIWIFSVAVIYLYFTKSFTPSCSSHPPPPSSLPPTCALHCCPCLF